MLKSFIQGSFFVASAASAVDGVEKTKGTL